MSKFPYFIASRYFLSKKNRHFINTIAIISMLAVAFGTAALVIVLSVFNGFSDTIEDLYDSFDPEITIVPAKTKVFLYDEDMKAKVAKVKGIENVTEVILDNVLIRYRGQQKVVQMKGVSTNFLKQSEFESKIVEGKPLLTKGEIDFALIGLGVQYEMRISMNSEFTYIQCWYPNRKVKSLGKNLKKSFIQKSIYPGGVFQVEQQYDDHFVFVPLRFAKDLLEYDAERSSLEINVKEGFDIVNVMNDLTDQLGEDYLIKDKLALHASLFKAMKLEKVFVFLSIILVIAIASINIFFSLSMLVIEKKKDMTILVTMGAEPKTVKAIFLTEGLLVGLTGAGIGLIFGFLICFVQQKFGLVSLGSDTSIVNAYPVSMRWMDFVLVGLSTFVITIVASIAPAIKASKITADAAQSL